MRVKYTDQCRKGVNMGYLVGLKQKFLIGGEEDVG